MKMVSNVRLHHDISNPYLSPQLAAADTSAEKPVVGAPRRRSGGR
jgi:hypothetical protein